MQNKGKLTIMKYFRACVGSFLVKLKVLFLLNCETSKIIAKLFSLSIFLFFMDPIKIYVNNKDTYQTGNLEFPAFLPQIAL